MDRLELIGELKGNVNSTRKVKKYEWLEKLKLQYLEVTDGEETDLRTLWNGDRCERPLSFLLQVLYRNHKEKTTRRYYDWNISSETISFE